MKKVLVVFLVLSLLLSVAACASDTGEESAATEETEAEDTAATETEAEDVAAAETETEDVEEAAEEAAVENDDTVYTLNVSFAAPEFSTLGVTEALNRIQEASNGRIEMTYYYSWSLTSVATVVDDLNSGIIDIAAVPISEHTSMFPYSNLISYTPFLGLPGLENAAEIFDELYYENEAMQAEYANVGLKYWTNYMMPGYNIYTTQDYEITTPEDLKGLKLISSSSLMQDYLTSYDCAAVSTPVTEYATSLNTNVVDGAVTHINVLNAFGCIDFITAGTVFGDSGTAMAPMAVCISEAAWSELPADLQQLFEDEADNLRVDQCGYDTQTEIDCMAALEEAGAAIKYLTDEEIAVWSDAFEAQRQDYVDELIAQGSTEAQTLYDSLMEKLAAYE